MERIIEETIKFNYGGIVPEHMIKRYADLIKRRAIRFYLENNLDLSTVEEDLYHEDDSNDPYPNLSYSEQVERDYSKKEFDLMGVRW